MLSVEIYDSDYENKWCPGCGNFGILAAMKDAFAHLDLAPHQLLIISGIGQAGKTPHFMQCNMFHGLHGRALPLATGAKLANHNLTVLVSSGDGDCYGEGGNHFIHAIRRNANITLLVHNNQVYGLTKGQASPTAEIGFVTKMQKGGVIMEPFNPLAVSLALGIGFLARGFSGNKAHLSQLIQEGIMHNGFSLIDIYQPCVSFNPVNTYAWYNERIYDLAEEGYVPEDFEKAMALATNKSDKLPIGIIYKKEKQSFTEKIPGLAAGPLVDNAYDPARLQAVLDELSA